MNRSVAPGASPGCGRPRSEEVRQRIMQAANELLQEKGFRAMTIEGIAERAAASKVTIYRWWPSKAAIVLEAFLEQVTQRLPYKESSLPLEDLGDYMVRFTETLTGPTGTLIAGLLAEGVLDPAVGKAYLEHWQKPRRAEARKLLDRAVSTGDLDATSDMEAVLDMFFGPLYYRLMVRHLPLTADFAQDLWKTVSLGLAARRL